MTQATERAGAMRYLPAMAIAVVAIVGVVAFRDALGFEALARHRETLLAAREAYPVGAAAGFVAAYAAIVGFSLPGALIATLTGGFLFGVFPGALLNVTGATLGAIAIFLAARLGAGDRLSRHLDASGGTIGRMKAGFDGNQWSMLFLIRLVPAVPFFAANLLPALVGVPLHRFAVSTFLGIIPGTVVYTSVGAGLGDVFAQGETPDLGVIFEPHVLLPIIGLCVLAALPMALKALRGRKDI